MKLEGLRINLAKTYVAMLRFTATSMKSYLKHVFLILLIEIIIIKKAEFKYIYNLFTEKHLLTCNIFQMCTT